MSEHRALRIGVVGLGQCGGNFAAELASRGYRALAVNTSQTDLRSTGGLDEEQLLYLGTDGLNGTGGAAAVGAECLSARGSEIQDVVGPWTDVDAFMVVAGLGGGTGANLAHVVELLYWDERPVLALVVLPSSSESHTAKVNALLGLNDLLDAPFEALMVVDNQRLQRAFANAGIDQFLREGNRAVVAALDEINGLWSVDGLSSIRSLDPGQLQRTLLSGGVVVFASREVSDPLSPEVLLDTVRSAVADHEHLGSGYELDDAVVLSAVLVASDDVLADTPATVFADFATELKGETGGADLHLGIYSGEVEPARLHLMVGGLPLPSRAQELLEEAATEAERFSAKKAPRTKLQKLDLSGLAAINAGLGLTSPSFGGKGMAKISAGAGGSPAGVGEPLESGQEPGPLVDLDFDEEEPSVVEEEIVGDDGDGLEVVEEEFQEPTDHG